MAPGDNPAPALQEAGGSKDDADPLRAGSRAR